MPMAWRTAVSVALSLACTSASDSLPIFKLPTEIRKRNYVRLSTKTCDECMTMEDFYAANPLGFVLFYERALMQGHKYKDAIVEGWMKVCEELRYSRVACGMVDMVSDLDYAKRYIDPKTAPAHIIVRAGQPVLALQEQVKPLLQRPGDKATMLAHVGDLLREEGTLGSLSLSASVDHRDALSKLVQKHKIVVAAFTGDDRRLSDVFRAGVQEAVLAHGLSYQMELSSDERAPRRGKGGKDQVSRFQKAKERARIAFVSANGNGVTRHHQIPQGSIGIFVNGELQPNSELMKAGTKLVNDELIAAIKKSVEYATMRARESIETTSV